MSHLVIQLSVRTEKAWLQSGDRPPALASMDQHAFQGDRMNQRWEAWVGQATFVVVVLLMPLLLVQGPANFFQQVLPVGFVRPLLAPSVLPFLSTRLGISKLWRWRTRAWSVSSSSDVVPACSLSWFAVNLRQLDTGFTSLLWFVLIANVPVSRVHWVHN